MTEANLRRTVRRTAAVLLLPLSMLVVQFSIHLRKTAGLVDSGAVNTAKSTGYALIVVSVVYMVGSAVIGLYTSFQRENSSSED
jgi:hypothetical protein